MCWLYSQANLSSRSKLSWWKHRSMVKGGQRAFLYHVYTRGPGGCCITYVTNVTWHLLPRMAREVREVDWWREFSPWIIGALVINFHVQIIELADHMLKVYFMEWRQSSSALWTTWRGWTALPSPWASPWVTRCSVKLVSVGGYAHTYHMPQCAYHTYFIQQCL